jgi:glycosyltransferase involved in cell wall biosynthesis
MAEAGTIAAQVASEAYPGSTAPIVSVIVSTFSRAPFLADLVTALARQTFDLRRFEVILVDDASPDDTWDRIVALARRTPLRLLGVRLAANSGQGPGRNAGVSRARSPLVAFTDDDCIPSPEWLAELTAPLLSDGGATSRPRVVQGRTEPWPDDASTVGPWCRTVHVVRPTWLFETCNVAYRACDFERAGGFPGRGEAPVERSGKLVGEDALLGWRVTMDGAELSFAAGALVHHRHLPASYADWLAGQRGKAVFPALVGRSAVGRRALWRRWFLARRTAAFDGAVAGALAAVLLRRPRWLLCAGPWVWSALPDAAARPGRHPAVRLAQVAVGDLVSLAALLTGSVRSRTLVL